MTPPVLFPFNYAVMKTLLLFILIAALISASLTLFWLAKPAAPSDPLRTRYTAVFSTFGAQADAIAHQFGEYGLILLQRYQVQGLVVLEQYGQVVTALQPYLPGDLVFDLCRQRGPALEQVLEQFQPAVVADLYDQVGRPALHYVLDESSRYFLLRRYGERLVQLAEAKGPLVFDLIRKHEPEFLELYYDDTLLKTISRFGAQGLMAVKQYRGMAVTVFEHFADDARFAVVLRQYGYQQVVPIVHYFYHTPAPLLTGLPSIFQPDDQMTREQQQFDRASRAVQQVYEQGHTFLRQFQIAEDGAVTPLATVTLANALERVMFGRLPASQPAAAEAISCEQLAFALNLLGLLPAETTAARQARCLYWRTALPAVTDLHEVAGVLALQGHAGLVAQYGEVAIPFVTRYGEPGANLLEATDGAALEVIAQYGQEYVPLLLKYGADAVDLAARYGEPALSAIAQTDGAAIPALQQHGPDVLAVLEQPQGAMLFQLSSVFGPEVLTYAQRYPDDFPRYLLLYGRLALTALRTHDEAAVTAAQQHGDDMIRYLGLYEDAALRLIQAGLPGVTLLRTAPPEFWDANQDAAQAGVLGAAARLLWRHPRRFHAYIGQLGASLTPFEPVYIQGVFWAVVVLIVLVALRLLFLLAVGIFG